MADPLAQFGIKAQATPAEDPLAKFGIQAEPAEDPLAKFGIQAEPAEDPLAKFGIGAAPSAEEKIEKTKEQMGQLREQGMKTKLVRQAISPLVDIPKLAAGKRVTPASLEEMQHLLEKAQLPIEALPPGEDERKARLYEEAKRRKQGGILGKLAQHDVNPEPFDPYKHLTPTEQDLYFRGERLRKGGPKSEEAPLSEPEQQEYEQIRRKSLSPVAKHQEDLTRGAVDATGRGVMSTLDFADAVLNAPVRPAAETVDAARKYLSWYLQGMEGEAPDYSPGKAFMREPGTATGFGDVFRNSYQQGVGGRDLNLAEHAALTIAGILPDALIGGRAWRAVMPIQRVPAAQSMRQNVSNALEQSGVDVASGKTPWWKPQLSSKSPPSPTPPREGQVVPEVLDYVADVAASPPERPKQLDALRTLTQKIGQMYGMNAQQVVELDANLIRQLGEQGGHATKTGWLPSLQKNVTSRMRPEQIEAIQAPEANALAYGAGQVKGPLREAGRKILGMFSSGRGAPAGVQESIRGPQGRAMAAEKPTSQSARAIADSFETPERAEQVTQYVDAAYTQANAASDVDKSKAALEAFEEAMGKVEDQVKAAMGPGSPFKALEPLQEGAATVKLHPGVSGLKNQGLAEPLASAQRDLTRLDKLSSESVKASAAAAVARKAAQDKLPQVVASFQKVVTSERRALQTGVAAGQKTLQTTKAGAEKALAALAAAEKTGDQAAASVARARVYEAIVRHGRGYQWSTRSFGAPELPVPIGATSQELAAQVQATIEKEAARLTSEGAAGLDAVGRLESTLAAETGTLQGVRSPTPDLATGAIVRLNKALRGHTAGLSYGAQKKIRGGMSAPAKEAKAALSELRKGEGEVAKLGERAGRIKGGILAKVREPVSRERIRYQERLVRQQRVNAHAEELAAKGWAPKTPEEREAFGFMKQEFADANVRDQKLLGQHGAMENYLARLETEGSKRFLDSFRSASEKGGGSSNKGFLKGREPRDITIKGTRLHQFELHPAKIYAERMARSHMLWAAAESENNTLYSYGTRIGSELDSSTRANIMDAARKRGDDVVFYSKKFGDDAGDIYVLDRRADDLLSKVMNPEVHSKLYRDYQDVMGWWKTMATVSRPSFVERNFLLGNLMNMFLGDMNVADLTLWKDAAKVMSMRNAQHWGKLTPAERVSTAVLGRGAGLDTVVRGKTIREWHQIMDEAKVFSKGQVGFEPGMAPRVAGEAPPSKAQLLNPLSKEFFWYKSVGGFNTGLEGLSKTFAVMDRIGKGFKPWEAGQAVADFLFNYDETSKVLGSSMTSVMSAFPKFKYKNYGLQFASLFARPDRLSQAMSARNKIQELDPTDSQDVSRGMIITRAGRERLERQERGLPLSVRTSELFRVPFLRGKEGSRVYFPEKSATPWGQLGELAADALIAGDVADWRDALLVTVNDWLGPIPAFIEKSVVAAGTGQWLLAGDQTRRSDDSSYVDAPSLFSTMLEYAKNSDSERIRDIYHGLTQHTKIFRPATGLADGQLVDIPGKYIWPRWARETIEAGDPVFGVLRRAFGDDALDYWSKFSVFGLGKPIDATQGWRLRQKVKSGQKLQDDINELERGMKQRGEVHPLQ